jgi:large subunit ribosomal protein L29
VNDIKALSSDELQKQLREAQREVFDLRMKASTKQLVNHRDIPRAKKKIAVIKTILRERELAG